jgi:hypothetical protein
MAWTDPRTGTETTDPRGPDWQYPASNPVPPPPPPPVPSPPNKWTPWIAIAAALLVASALGFALTTAWTDDDERPFTRPVVPQQPSIGPIPTFPPSLTIPPPLTIPTPPTTTPTTVPAVPADPDAAALRRIVVVEGDVPADHAVDLIPGGDQTGDEVTLDLCNGTYPSEALRTARRQVEVTDPNLARTFSTEAVLYGSEAQARQAMRELNQARAACPTGPRLTPNGELVTTTFGPTPDTAWPRTAGITRQAYDWTNTDILFDDYHTVAVYLQRGRVLLALYFSNVDEPRTPIQGKTELADITAIFERRLASLPPSVVDAP